jgi:hypothetical protein
MSDDRMTLKEFVDDITKEMKENGWENLPLEFCTSDREAMHYLSIYDVDNDDNTTSIIIDVGDDNE